MTDTEFEPELATKSDGVAGVDAAATAGFVVNENRRTHPRPTSSDRLSTDLDSE
jgi:hypothetical protein